MPQRYFFTYNYNNWLVFARQPHRAISWPGVYTIVVILFLCGYFLFVFLATVTHTLIYQEFKRFETKLCLKRKKKERSQYPGARNLWWLVLENWGAIRPGNEVDTAETYPGRSGMKPGEVGRVTWVNFSWVCAAGLSEPLSHYSLFCFQV